MFDQNGYRKYLSSAERRAYLQAIKAEPKVAHRAFLLTLYYSGCRISEALNLVVRRVDLSTGALIMETLKRRKRGCFRAVPVPDALLDLLREVITGRDPNERIWEFSRTTGWRMVKAKMEEARIWGGMACPKGLRHGHAVACVSKKIPLPTVQKWLGHARLETTAIYLDVHAEEERELARRLW